MNVSLLSRTMTRRKVNFRLLMIETFADGVHGKYSWQSISTLLVCSRFGLRCESVIDFDVEWCSARLCALANGFRGG